MKKRYIVAAVAVAVVGLAGAQQFSYKKAVHTIVEQLIIGINTSAFNDNAIHAQVHSQQSTLFSSAGVLTMVTKEQNAPTEFELKYTVSHGPTAIFMGAHYKVNMVNNMFEGKRDETITTEIFNGQAIVTEGTLRPNSITGTLSLPAVYVADSGQIIHIEPVTSKYSASHFNQYGVPQRYQVSIEAPSFTLSGPKPNFNIVNSTLSVTNHFTQKSGFGNLHFTIEEANALYASDISELSKWTLNRLVLNSDLSIDKELTNTTVFTLGNLNVNDAKITDTELSYSLNGIDGQTALKLMQLSDTARYEQWQTAEYENALNNLLLEREHHLLAFNPHFNIQHFRAYLNDEILVNASGTAELDTQQLPPNFMAAVLEGNDQSLSLNFLEALLVEFDLELGDGALQLLEYINPMVAAVASNLERNIRFEMKHGEITLNGD